MVSRKFFSLPVRILVFLVVFENFLVVFSFGEGPKLFVDVQAIRLIDPLVSGFNLILTKNLVENYLNPTKMPTIYVTAAPLRSEEPLVTRLLYREDVVENLIKIDGLAPKSWYVICLEFENVVRHHTGNTSTECRTVRTLDEFGKSTESTISDVRLSYASASELELQLSVEVDFPLQLTAFFDRGSSPAQIFIFTRSKSVRVFFANLLPGHDYGKFCLIEHPQINRKTAMGRHIDSKIHSCHFDSVKTSLVEKSDRKISAAAQIFQFQNAAASKFSSSPFQFSSFSSIFYSFSSFSSFFSLFSSFSKIFGAAIFIFFCNF